MKTINQFLKNSFKGGFYFKLIEEFKKNNRYVDFAHETKKSDNINEKFKGVQVIRHKEKNIIYSISSHGTFTRKLNKETRTSFNDSIEKASTVRVSLGPPHEVITQSRFIRLPDVTQRLP